MDLVRPSILHRLRFADLGSAILIAFLLPLANMPARNQDFFGIVIGAVQTESGERSAVSTSAEMPDESSLTHAWTTCMLTIPSVYGDTRDGPRATVKALQSIKE
jgi:hypothetical protein